MYNIYIYIYIHMYYIYTYVYVRCGLSCSKLARSHHFRRMSSVSDSHAPHLSTSHVPLISGNVAIYRPMLAMGMSLVTNMNDSCPTYK